MRQRRREGKPLKRATASRPELRTVVVFCEGRNSEPDYINGGLKRLPEIAHNTAARRAEQLERRHTRDGTAFPNDNPSSGMHHVLRALEPT